MEFIECASCSAKPGTPALCEACLNNRRIISDQHQEIERHRSAAQVLRSVLDLTDRV